MPPARSRRAIALRAALALGLGSAILGLLLARLPIAQAFEWSIYDLRMRRTIAPAGAPKRIAIVEIDEQTLRALEPIAGRWPWPRLFHGGLIDYLARGPAAVVAYDVGFFEADGRSGFDVGGDTWTGADSDAVFVESVQKAGNVVLLAEATYAGSAAGKDADVRRVPPIPGLRIDGALEERPIVRAPFEALAQAARGVGHNLFVLDTDGPLRRTTPFLRSEGHPVPSLAMAAYLALARVPPASVRLDGPMLAAGDARLPLLSFDVPRLPGEAGAEHALHALIRFRGPAVQADGTPTYRTYSFGDLLVSEDDLQNGRKPRVDPAVFKDAIVFVGVTAAGLHDVFVTPLGTTGKIPGAQIHATVMDQLLTHTALVKAPTWAVTTLTAVLALAVAFLTVLLPMRWGALSTLALAGIVAVASLAVFRAGTWVPLVPGFLGIAIAGVGGLAWQYFVEGRDKRLVTQLFSRYVSKDVFDQVLANPELAELGGRRRTMSVLFSDMRGFTAMTERGDPEALVVQLNEYFSRMVEVVFANQGTIDKFVGDMVMALFGAPVDDPDHADHAVATAIEMVRALEVLNARWVQEGRPALGIGIGVNSGEMIAGNIGSASIRGYTVIGDAVNLGARLESLNKEHGTTIIISAATAARLTTTPPMRPLGSVVVKGKSVPVDIFEVLVGDNPSGPVNLTRAGAASPPGR
jgi:adenylate cyclase